MLVHVLFHQTSILGVLRSLKALDFGSLPVVDNLESKLLYGLTIPHFFVFFLHSGMPKGKSDTRLLKSMFLTLGFQQRDNLYTFGMVRF